MRRIGACYIAHNAVVIGDVVTVADEFTPSAG